MSEVATLFHVIGDDIAELFGHLPKDKYETVVKTTTDLVKALNVAKTFLGSPEAASAANIFGNGIGNIVLSALQGIVNKVLPFIEIAQGAEAAIATITNPVEKADAIIKYILANINKLPAAWQGKHWLNIAVSILTEALSITQTEANALINTQLGLIEAGKA